LLPQWWALAAQPPQARRGRLLLVVLGPLAVLATNQNFWLHREPREIMGCYLVASAVSAAWMFRRWAVVGFRPWLGFGRGLTGNRPPPGRQKAGVGRM